MFPLSPDLYTTTNPNLKESIDPEDMRPSPNSTFYNPNKWSAFLKKSADEAQILVHNLRLQEYMNRSGGHIC